MTKEKIGKRHSQTFFTSGLGVALTALSTSILPEENIQLGIYTSILVAPFISSFLAKIYNNINEPEELTAYKRSLRRDIKELRKLLKDDNISEGKKEETRTLYENSCLKLAQANSKYQEGELILKPVNSML